MPGEFSVANRSGDAIGPLFCPREQDLERLLGEDLEEGGAHRGNGERISGERASDAADVGGLHVDPDSITHLRAHSVRGGGKPACDRLADHQHVRLEIPGPRASTWTGAERVRFVEDQDGAVAAGQRPERIVILGLRRNDPDVRHGRFGQDRCDPTICERGLERRHVIPLDHTGRHRRVDRWTDVPVSCPHPALGVQRGERLVDGPVVAVVIDQHDAALGDLAREPQRKPIGVGRRQRELPDRKTKAAGEFLADERSVLGGEHGRHAALELRGDRGDGRRGPMPGHRAGITQAQVDVVVPIGATKVGAFRFLDNDGEAARPLRHPVHRHATQQRMAGALEQASGARVRLHECRPLAIHELADPCSRDNLRRLGRHGTHHCRPRSARAPSKERASAIGLPACQSGD